MSPFHSIRKILFGALVLSILTATGCSSSKLVVIRGKLVLPKGFTPESSDSISINLTPTEMGPDGRSAGASVDKKDLTFTINGGEGKGVPPGKYRVTVTCTGYAGTQNMKKHEEDIKKAFKEFGPDKSTLSMDVADAQGQTFTIDLEKKTVSK